MRFTRRKFIKLAGAGVASIPLAKLGFDLGEVKAHAAGLKMEGTKEVISICPFCSVGCHILVHVRNGEVVNTEGDADYPVSEGALCAKGAAMLSMGDKKHRVTKPLYRAPYSDRWEEKSWDWMLQTIAKRVKETRDRDFIRYNYKGQEVNRVESIFQLGTSQMDNEECALSHQFLRGLGVVYMDHQARI